MTANCSTTHFYVGGIPIPSGQATYTSPQGLRYRVVCTTPKNPGEIHFRDLPENAAIDCSSNGIELSLTYRENASQGAAGRARFLEDFDQFQRSGASPAALREYAMIALRHLPGEQSGQSVPYSETIVQTCLDLVDSDPAALADALLTTNLVRYVPAPDVYRALATQPDVYRGALATLVDQAGKLPSLEDLDLVNVTSDHAVLAKCQQSLNRATAAVDMVMIAEDALTGGDAIRLARSLAALRSVEATSSGAQDLIDRFMTTNHAKYDSQIGRVLRTAPVATPPAVSAPTPAPARPKTSRSERVDQVDQLRFRAAEENGRWQRRLHTGGESDAHMHAVTASATQALEDLMYHQIDEESRRVVRTVHLAQQDYAANEAFARGSAARTRATDVAATANAQDALTASILDILAHETPDPSKLTKDCDELLRSLEQRLSEIDRADGYAQEACMDAVRHLAGNASAHRDMLAQQLLNSGVDRYDLEAPYAMLGRQCDYEFVASELTAEFELARTRRRDLYDVLAAAIREHYAPAEEAVPAA